MKMSKIKFKNGNAELIEKPKYYTIEDCNNGDFFMHNNNLYLMVDTCGMLIFGFNTYELKDFEDYYISDTDPIAMYCGEIEIDIEKFKFM